VREFIFIFTSTIHKKRERLILPSNQDKKVAIIGAGPAGMTAAYELVKSGIKVEVFESSDWPGGMARTIELWNQKVDLGPHRFFSRDKRVNQLWLEVIGDDYKVINRLTRIFYQGKLYHYPLNPFNALNNLGLKDTALCVFYFLKEMIRPTRQNGSFESWVTHRFGKRLYEIFFKPYSEKLWGIPCVDLDSDFASQRIKKLSLLEALKNAFLKNKKHRTLLDQFAYPCQGTGSLYQRMAKVVESKQGKIYYNSPVERLTINGYNSFELGTVDGKKHNGFTDIVSTMPLSLLINRLSHVPARVIKAAGDLKFRNTILVYLNINEGSLFPDQWIYVQSPEFQVGRITNFRNWVPELYGQEKSTILVMEYWCNDEDAMWKESKNNLVELASRELRAIGLCKSASILDGHVVKLPRCYPVYYKGYKENIKIIQEYLKTIPNLSVIGRYGSFKYNNQDHSILMGIQAAANIVKEENYDLWSINTDYEDYQESFVIRKTGLVKE
jgi:protoporphyrinogen oxidase